VRIPPQSEQTEPGAQGAAKRAPRNRIRYFPPSDDGGSPAPVTLTTNNQEGKKTHVQRFIILITRIAAIVAIIACPGPLVFTPRLLRGRKAARVSCTIRPCTCSATTPDAQRPSGVRLDREPGYLRKSSVPVPSGSSFRGQRRPKAQPGGHPTRWLSPVRQCTKPRTGWVTSSTNATQIACAQRERVGRRCSAYPAAGIGAQLLAAGNSRSRPRWVSCP